MHRIFLLLDGRQEFELGAAAVEVVSGAVNLVVGISREVVGEEANPLLECDDLGCGNEMTAFSGSRNPLAEAR